MGSEFPSNSQNPKKPTADPSAKKIEKVVTGEVIKRKKPLGRKFKDTFTGEDTRNVVKEVWMSFIIPSVKEVIADALNQGVERKLFGESRRRGARRGFSPITSMFNDATYSAYNRISLAQPAPRDDPRSTQPRSVARTVPGKREIDEIILNSRAEGQEVLDQLYNIVNDYGLVTVADLCSLVGAQSQFTDQNWGWNNLQGSDVQKIREGYLLTLPPVQPIE